jgi:hypothetical protein
MRPAFHLHRDIRHARGMQILHGHVQMMNSTLEFTHLDGTSGRLPPRTIRISAHAFDFLNFPDNPFGFLGPAVTTKLGRVLPQLHQFTLALAFTHRSRPHWLVITHHYAAFNDNLLTLRTLL